MLQSILNGQCSQILQHLVNFSTEIVIKCSLKVELMKISFTFHAQTFFYWLTENSKGHSLAVRVVDIVNIQNRDSSSYSLSFTKTWRFWYLVDVPRPNNRQSCSPSEFMSAGRCFTSKIRLTYRPTLDPINKINSKNKPLNSNHVKYIQYTYLNKLTQPERGRIPPQSSKCVILMIENELPASGSNICIRIHKVTDNHADWLMANVKHNYIMKKIFSVWSRLGLVRPIISPFHFSKERGDKSKSKTDKERQNLF